MNKKCYFLVILLAVIFYSCQNVNNENQVPFKPFPKKDILPEAMIFLESKTIEGSWDTIPSKKNSAYNLILEQKLAPDQETMIKKAGDEIQFIITVTNLGDFSSGNFKVENIIPAGLDYLNADNRAEEYGGVISWNHLNELDPGEILELKYSLSVAPMPRQWRSLEEIKSDSEEDFGFSDVDRDSLSN